MTAETQSKPKADAVSTNAATVLGQIRKGQFLYDLSQKMEELVADIREHKKGGKIAITLKFETMNAGDADTLQVVDEISVSKPKPTRAKSIFFTTKANTLVREDPRQRELEL